MMTEQIYRVTIRGRSLESRNVRELLARAVSEKRKDRRLGTVIQPGLGTVTTVPNPAHGFSKELISYLI